MKKIFLIIIVLCLALLVGQAGAKEKPPKDLSQATVAQWLKAKKNKKMKAAVKWVEGSWMPSAQASDADDMEEDDDKDEQRAKPKEEDKRVKKSKKEMTKKEKARVSMATLMEPPMAGLMEPLRDAFRAA